MVQMRKAVAATVIITIAFASLSASVSAERDQLYVTQEEVDFLNWWNNDSADRTWGCDSCITGDIACSLGAAIAAKRNDPTRPCGFDTLRADYYGYLDTDDWRVSVNPIYWNADNVTDTKTDWESGIPDIAIVQKSIESIKTDIDAYWVKESNWTGPPYWMSLHDPGPRSDQVDWQEWLMPCADSSGVEYRCRWTDCQRSTPSPGASCPCATCPGSCPDPANASATVTCGNSDCDWDWTPAPMSECTGIPADADYTDGGAPSGPNEFCCWECDPMVPGTPDDAADYCGPGGAWIEEDNESSGQFVYYSNETNESDIRPGWEYMGYEGYPHHKNATGEDVNDDLKVYDMATGTYMVPGRNHPKVLQHEFAEDLVRDRYWKPNGTSKEFKGSRPGYCAWEGYYLPNGDYPTQCEEGDHYPYGMRAERDDYDRPASKQHDPCAPCQGYDYIYPNGDPGMCEIECYNYDLRYYRQFNIDSVWVNVFKIVPEVNEPLKDDETIPDTVDNCLDTRPGVHLCSLLNVHEGDCDNDDDCIPGLECIGPQWWNPGDTDLCCPPGSDVRESCCKNPDSGKCYELEMACPPYAMTVYQYGIGEPGCDGDDECAEFKEPQDPSQVITQHCSEGGF